MMNCAASVPAAAQSKSAGVRGNPGDFFGPDEYPPEAIRAGQEGRVLAKLWIDTTGRVASCTVTQSSGSTSLDQKTCEIALAKVTFQPATDSKGRPIAATYTLPVRWVLPHGPVEVGMTPPPLESAEIVLSIDSAGRIAGCRATISPVQPGGRGPCDDQPVGKQSDYLWTRNGKPVGGTVTIRGSQQITLDP